MEAEISLIQGGLREAVLFKTLGRVAGPGQHPVVWRPHAQGGVREMGSVSWGALDPGGS